MSSIPIEEIKRIFSQCECHFQIKRITIPNGEDKYLSVKQTQNTYINLPDLGFENCKNKAKESLRNKLKRKKLSLWLEDNSYLP